VPGTSKAIRHLDAYQTAVFVQSFFAVAISGRVQHQHPAITAHVYRVDVTGSWNGVGTMSTAPVFFASDGTHAWIAAGVPANTPVPKLDFWIAPDRVVSAFQGTATLVPTGGVEAVTPSTTTLGRVPTHDDAGHTAWPWIVGGIALVVGAALAFVATRARRGAGSPHD
jgi:hypothetical protein